MYQVFHPLLCMEEAPNLQLESEHLTFEEDQQLALWALEAKNNLPGHNESV